MQCKSPACSILQTFAFKGTQISLCHFDHLLYNFRIMVRSEANRKITWKCWTLMNLDGIFWSKQVHYVDFRIQLIWTSLTNLTNLAIFAISANKTILCQIGQFVTNLIIFWYLDNFESFLFKISPIVGKSQTIIKKCWQFWKLKLLFAIF